MGSLNFEYEFNFLSPVEAPVDDVDMPSTDLTELGSFTDVCSISESHFNLGRSDRNTNENTDDIPTDQNTDTNNNYPIIDQTVMAWKRILKSFCVRMYIGCPMYIGC